MADVPLTMDSQDGPFPSREPRLISDTPLNDTHRCDPVLPAWNENPQPRHPSKCLGDNSILLNDKKDIENCPAPQNTQQRDATMATGSSTPGDPSLVYGSSGVVDGPHMAPANQSVTDLKDATDDELLQILFKNETLASRFQRACTSRVEQHKQSLENAYNQRLSDLEKYTREWRDTTQELWLAIKEGKFPSATRRHQEALAWSGPQQTAHSLGPVSLPMRLSVDSIAAQARTEPRDSDGQATISHHAPIPDPITSHGVGPPVPSPSEQITPQSPQAVELQSATIAQDPLQLQLSAAQIARSQSHGAIWVDDTQGFKEDKKSGGLTTGSSAVIATVCSGSLGPNFQRFLRIPEARRMVVKYVDEEGRSTYRDIKAIHSVLEGILNTDVLIDLTYPNVALLGKALCYLKDRRDRLWSLGKLPRDRFVDDEVQELCAFFSLQPTIKTLRIKRFDLCGPRLSSIVEAEKRSRSGVLRLLIARPRHRDGRIKGVHYFDVGMERRTARLKTEMPIILPEDASTLNDIANFLKFCAKYVASVKSMVLPMSAQHQVGSSSEPVKSKNQDVVQPVAAGRYHQASDARARPLTLFERTLKLSSEHNMLTQDTPCQHFRNKAEQSWLHRGAEPRSTSQSPGDSESGDILPVSRHTNSKGVDHFGDNAFRDFCENLMDTETDTDGDSDVIILDGPPRDTSSVPMSESEGDESDDLIMLEGPPPNVTFGRQTLRHVVFVQQSK